MLINFRMASMHVFIELADESEFKVNIDAHDKVEFLKSRIEKLRGYPASRQKLMYHGKLLSKLKCSCNRLIHEFSGDTLDLRRKLEYYKIRNNSTIKLIVKQPPPPKRLDQDPKRSDHGSKRPDQGSKRSDHGSKRLDQDSKRSDQGSKRLDQDSKRPDHDYKHSDQGSKHHDQGSKRSDHDHKHSRLDYKLTGYMRCLPPKPSDKSK
jgi:hypothetical protein